MRGFVSVHERRGIHQLREIDSNVNTSPYGVETGASLS